VLADAFTRDAGGLDASTAVALPAEPWAEGYATDRRYREEQLNGLLAHASQEALLGVLTALQREPDPRAYDVGYGWATLVHRMVRSELIPAGAKRAGGGGAAPERAGFLKFIEEELSDARQVKLEGGYASETKAYLELVGDYIRYQ
jgi:hypothetical protein